MCGRIAAPASISEVGRTLRALVITFDTEPCMDEALVKVVLALPALEALKDWGFFSSNSFWRRFLSEWLKLHPGADLIRILYIDDGELLR